MTTKINLYKDGAIMHSIIKNLSKVLALTTMFSPFAILPGAKVSGTEPPCATFPPLHNSFDLSINNMLPVNVQLWMSSDSLRVRLNDQVSFGSSLFGRHPRQNVEPSIACSILAQLNELFGKYQTFTTLYTAYCRSEHDKFFIGSFAEIPSEKLAAMCTGSPNAVFVSAKTSGVDRGMYFNCAGEDCSAKFLKCIPGVEPADLVARFIVSHQFFRLMLSFYLSKGLACDPLTALSRLKQELLTKFAISDISELIGESHTSVSSDPAEQAAEALCDAFAYASCDTYSPSTYIFQQLLSPECLAELLSLPPADHSSPPSAPQPSPSETCAAPTPQLNRRHRPFKYKKYRKRKK